MRICGHCVDTGDIVLLKQVLELRETSANIVLCISFMNYLYLLGEYGSPGVDTGNISLHEHVLELIDTSANIAQSNFLNYMYFLSENGGHGVDIGNISLTEHVLELIDTSANIVRCNFLELTLTYLVRMAVMALTLTTSRFMSMN